MQSLNTTALTRVFAAAREVGQVDAGAVQFADGGPRVAGPGQGVAPLVGLDAPGGPVVQKRAGLRFETPALDDRIGRHAHLADGPLRIFPPATAQRLWPGTGSSR